MPTSARATGSPPRSAGSPAGTRTRTSGTTPSSPGPSPTARWRARPASRYGQRGPVLGCGPSRPAPGLSRGPSPAAVARMGLLVEFAVGAVVGALGPVERLPQVVRLVRGLALAGLLGVVAGPGQVPVKQRGYHPV